jgi:hypothetical protein
MTTVSLGTRQVATAVTILAPFLAMPPASESLPTMKPEMFCRKIRGVPRWSAEFDEVGALERGLAEEHPVVGHDADLVPGEGGEPGDQGGAVLALELV